jgi:hypothetical protein
MNLTLNFDAQALLHPQFMASVNAAAAILDAAIANPINVAIDVGYGEVGGRPVASGSAEGGPSTLTSLTYTALRSDLAVQASASNLELNQALAALPVGSTLEGRSQFFITQAQAQAFALVPSGNPTTTGQIGIATDITGSDATAVALHELTHAMGRTQDAFGNPTEMGLFRFTAPGVHAFASSATSTYFSIDNGATNLASYGVSSDTSDFLNSSATSNDSFDEFFTPGKVKTHLTPLDLKQLDALGFSIQAPTISGPASGLTASGVGSPTSFSSGQFQIADAVDPDGTYQAVVTASHGTVATGGRLGTVTGSGTGSLVLTGSLADVNGDLSLLSFTGTSVGTGSLTIAANDGIVASTPQIFSISISPAVAVAAITPGRVPEIAFDTSYYLAQNSDVKAAGIDPQSHFDQFGWHEGRNPDAVFDVAYYLANNPDVAQAGIDPLLHYELFGWKEGRNPSASFNTDAYLARNTDVALAGMNPLDHYLVYGAAEHRALA